MSINQPKLVVMLAYDGVSSLDVIGPLDVLSGSIFVGDKNTPDYIVEIVSPTGGLITTSPGGVKIDTKRLAAVNNRKIDTLMVAGTENIALAQKDKRIIDWLKRTAPKARRIASVCTGALILAEAGLLDGYKAATHWGYRDILNSYPEITQVDKRVVIDRNRISGGGITAGIDFALTVISEVVNEQTAHAMQLIFEYRPEPPYNSGGPETAPPEIVQAVQGKIASIAGDLWEFAENKTA